MLDDLAPLVGRVEPPAVLPAHVEGALGAVEITPDVLPLLGVVGGEVAVLPVGGEALKLKHGDLVVGNVGGLLDLVVDGLALHMPTAGAVNFLRILLLRPPENLVHPMNAPVTEGSVGVVEVFPPAAGVDGVTPLFRILAIVALRGGSAPHVPIEFLRRLAVFRGSLGPVAAVVNKGADAADPAGLSGFQKFHTRDIVRRNPPVRADLHHTVGGARGVYHRASLHNRVANRLLHVDMCAGLHRGDGNERVPVVGRGDNDDFRFLLVEQLPVVAVEIRFVSGLLLHARDRRQKVASVHFAQPDDLRSSRTHRFTKNVHPPPTRADKCDLVSLVRRILPPNQRGRENGRGTGKSGCFEETAAWSGVGEADLGHRKRYHKRHVLTRANPVRRAILTKSYVVTEISCAEWDVVETGDDNRFQAVDFGAGKYVAVGFGGLIMTSTDGTQWTKAASGITGNLYGVAYGGGKFAVTGRPSLHSSDGVNWEETSWYLTSRVHHRDDQFVGLGSGGISYGADGSEWTHESVRTAASITGLAYVADRWIAVGWDRTLLATDPAVSWNVFALASDGGTITSNVDLSQPFTEGTQITFTASPEDGHILQGFQNWGNGDTEENGNMFTLTVGGGDTLVTANFIPTPSYAIELEIDGDGTVSTEPPADSFLHGSEVTLTATPGPGQEFLDWQGSLRDSQNPFTFVIDRDLSLRVRFRAIPQVDLTTTVVGEGSIEVRPQADSYLRGTELTLTAVPAEGHKFIRWSRHLSGSENPIMLTMDGHKRVDAIFEQSSANYTLAVTSIGQGFVQQSVTGDTHQAGTEIVLTPVASPGHRFVRWTGAVGGNTSPLLLTMDGDKSINAEFEKVSGYAQWVENHFTPAQRANPMISGEAGDPDKDGADNFSEFYGNTDPWRRESIPRLTNSLFRLGDQTYFALKWIRPTNREGLTEHVEAHIAGDLWVADENYSTLGTTPKGNGYEEISRYRSIPVSATNRSGLARISVAR